MSQGNERCKDGWIRVSVRCVSGQQLDSIGRDLINMIRMGIFFQRWQGFLYSPYPVKGCRSFHTHRWPGVGLHAESLVCDESLQAQSIRPSGQHVKSHSRQRG